MCGSRANKIRVRALRVCLRVLIILCLNITLKSLLQFDDAQIAGKDKI